MIAPQRLRRISDVLNEIVIAVSVAVVVVMLSMSSLGIFFGFVLDSPLTWSYSLTRLFLPWLAMLSLTVAFKRGEHIAITLAVRNLPARVLRAVQVINLSVVALFGLALLWYGYGFFENSTQLFMVSDRLQVSHKWTAASVPLAGLVMCVHLLSGLSLVEHPEVASDIER
ncbi:MAG: TRAP transporter small permease [Candidatus Methylomirabilia bacterium]